MVAVWVDIFITWMANTFTRLFNLNIITFNNTTISYGEVLLYFAIASIVISFIFGVRINSGFFRPSVKQSMENAKQSGYQLGRQHGYDLAQKNIKPK